jgi:hypothetical protein
MIDGISNGICRTSCGTERKPGLECIFQSFKRNLRKGLELLLLFLGNSIYIKRFVAWYCQYQPAIHLICFQLPAAFYCISGHGTPASAFCLPHPTPPPPCALTRLHAIVFYCRVQCDQALAIHTPQARPLLAHAPQTLSSRTDLSNRPPLLPPSSPPQHFRNQRAHREASLGPARLHRPRSLRRKAFC